MADEHFMSSDRTQHQINGRLNIKQTNYHYSTFLPIFIFALLFRLSLTSTVDCSNQRKCILNQNQGIHVGWIQIE